MEYVNQKDLKGLAGKVITIKKVYPAYRKGFNPTTKKPEKFIQVDGIWNEEKRVDGQRIMTKKEPNFKDHKKVYDIVVSLDEMTYLNAEKYNKDLGAREQVRLHANEFTFQEVGASKIRDIAEATVAFGKVPQKDDGTPAYDWEDSFIDQLSGVSVMFSTKNVKKNIGGKDCEFAEFVFREAKPSASKVEEDEDNSLPF